MPDYSRRVAIQQTLKNWKREDQQPYYWSIGKGRFNLPGTGESIGWKPGRDFYTPVGKPLGQVQEERRNMGFWEDPNRVARYYHAIQNQPPGSEINPGLDQESITAAYKYMEFQNEGRPWYSWQRLSETDPGRDFLRSIPVPPDELLWDDEQEYAQQTYEVQEPQESLEMGGLTEAQLAELPWWQRAVLAFIVDPRTGRGRPWATGAAIGAAVGGAAGGLPGAGAGLVSGLLLGGAAGKYPLAADAMMLINYPFEMMERAIGTLAITTKKAGYAIAEGKPATGAESVASEIAKVINTLPAAWQAAHFGYEALPMFQSIEVSNEPPYLTRTPGVLDYYTPWDEGLRPETLGTDALIQIYDEIVNNTEGPQRSLDRWKAIFVDPWNWYKTESPEVLQIYAEAEQKFGFTGMLQDLIGSIITDPLNALPSIMGDAMKAPAVSQARRALTELDNIARVTDPAQARTLAEVIDLSDQVMRGYALEAAVESTNKPLEAMQLYGQWLRQGTLPGGYELPRPLRRIQNLTWLDRTIARVDAMGVPRIIEPYVEPSRLNRIAGTLTTTGIGYMLGAGVGGPVGGVLLGGLGGMFGYKKGFTGLISLTPASRASEVTNYASTNLGMLLEAARREPEAADVAIKYLRGLANTPDALARELSMNVLNSPEAAVFPKALQDFIPRADAMLSQYHAGDWAREMFKGIADVIGRPVEEIVAEFARTRERDTLFRQYVDAVMEGADESIKLAIQEGMDAGEFTPENMQGWADRFVNGGLPLNENEFYHNLYQAVGTHLSEWGADWFGVSPEPLGIRFAETVKAVQSLFLLGLNFNYLVNNAVNNPVTMAARGVLGLRTGKDIDAIWARVGYEPMRLGAGVGPEAGGAVDTAKVYDPIRKKTRVEGPLQTVKDGANKITSKVGLMTNLSRHAEVWASRNAVTEGFMQMWDNLWKPGVGYQPMPNDLRAALAAVDPAFPGLVESAIRGGLNPMEVEAAINLSVRRRPLDAIIPDIVRNMGQSGEEARATMVRLGLYDFLKDRLAGAESVADVRRGYTDLYDHVISEILEKQEVDLPVEVERVAERVMVEGGKAAWVELNTGVFMDETVTRLQDYYEWQRIFAQRDLIPEGEFQALIERQVLMEQARYRSLYNRHRATYLGIAQSLGMDNNLARSILTQLDAKEKIWKAFYEKKWADMRRHFRTAYKSGRARKAGWDSMKADHNRLYGTAIADEAVVLQKIDWAFGQMVRGRYDKGAADIAIRGMTDARRVREEMGRDMLVFQDWLYRQDRSPEWNDHQWSVFLDETVRPQWLGRLNEQLRWVDELNDYLDGRRGPEPAAPRAPEPGAPRQPTLDEAPRQPEPPEAPRAPEPEPMTEAAPGVRVTEEAGIPQQMTGDLRRRLADLGYTLEEIRTMDLIDAWRLVRDEVVSERMTAPRQPPLGEAPRIEEPPAAAAPPAPAPEPLEPSAGVSPETRRTLIDLGMSDESIDGMDPEEARVYAETYGPRYETEVDKLSSDEIARLVELGYNMGNARRMDPTIGRQEIANAERAAAARPSEPVSNANVIRGVAQRYGIATAHAEDIPDRGIRAGDYLSGSDIHILNAINKYAPEGVSFNSLDDIPLDVATRAFERRAAHKQSVAEMEAQIAARPKVELGDEWRMEEFGETPLREVDPEIAEKRRVIIMEGRDKLPPGISQAMVEGAGLLKMWLAGGGMESFEHPDKPGVFVQKSTNPPWYRRLFAEEGRLSRKAVENALQRIIDDEGRDVPRKNWRTLQRVKDAVIDRMMNPEVGEGPELPDGTIAGHPGLLLYFGYEDEAAQALWAYMSSEIMAGMTDEDLVNLAGDADSLEYLYNRMGEIDLENLGAEEYRDVLEDVPTPKDVAIDELEMVERARRVQENLIRERERMQRLADQWRTSVERPRSQLAPGDSRAIYRDGLETYLNLTAEQAEDTMRIMDNIARNLAADNDMTIDEWWQRAWLGMGEGGEGGFEQQRVRLRPYVNLDEIRRAAADIEFMDDWIDAAIEEFGLTRDAGEAGYILHDGRMLDFSGKREGGTPGHRAYDHRQIGYIEERLPEGADVTMGSFARQTGSLRWSWYGHGLNLDLYSDMTSAQARIIKEFIWEAMPDELYLDITDHNGNIIITTVIEGPTDATIDTIKTMADHIFYGRGSVSDLEHWWNRQQLYQVEDAHLVALHNLTPENLVYADSLGGLAVPSVAITDKNIQFDKYGSITLVGNKNLIDPERTPANKVYDADAYSPTAPEQVWKRLKQDDAYVIINSLRRAQELMDSWHIEDRLWDFLIRKPSKPNAVELKNHPEVKLAFLLEQGAEIEPVMRDVPLHEYWTNMEGPRAYLDANYEAMRKMYSNELVGSDLYRRYSQVISDAIDEWAAGKYQSIRQELIDNWKERLFDDNGLLHFGEYSRLERDYQRLGLIEVDRSKTTDLINQAMAGMDDAYNEWWSEKLDVFEPPMIKVKGRMVPATLDNMVEAMARRKILAAEETMTYGPGKARAASAKRFTSIEQMHRDEGRLVSKESLQEFINKIQEPVLKEYRNNLIDKYQWQNTWDALDAAHKALADYLKGGKRRSHERMEIALLRNGFRNVSYLDVEAGIEAAEILRDTPTQYFEAKPQRAVHLDEFSGAVIPDDSSPEVINVLLDHGLDYVTYQAGDSVDRQRALQQFYNRNGVLFQEDPQPWYYSQVLRTVEAMPQDVMPPQQLLAWLRKRPGIKAGEIRWTHLEEWLEDYGPEKRPMTIQEVQRSVSPDDLMNRKTSYEVFVGDETAPYAWFDTRAEAERYVANRKKGLVTKEEVASYLEHNQVRVEEKIRGEIQVTVDDLELIQGEDPNVRYVDAMGGQTPYRIVVTERPYDVSPDGLELYHLYDENDLIISGPDFDQIMRYLADKIDTEIGYNQKTLFDMWTFEGGRRYRELELTLPAPRRRLPTLEEYATYWARDAADPETISLYEFDLAAERFPIALYNATGGRRPPVYRQGHFPEKNLIAHARFEDRTSLDGTRTLFIEEVQSDWAVEGREKGFQGEFPHQAELDNVKARLDEIIEKQRQIAIEIDNALGSDDRGWREWSARQVFRKTTEGHNPMTTAEAARYAFGRLTGAPVWYRRSWDDHFRSRIPIELIDRYETIFPEKHRLMMEWDQLQNAQKRYENIAVPPTPFADGWEELVMKRMLRYAAENGYDRLSWGTGEMMVNFWTDALRKEVNEIRYAPREAGGLLYEVTLLYNGEAVRKYQDVTLDSLRDVVGDVNVNKMKAGEGTQGDRLTKILHEDDLQVGGVGMINTYDRRMVKAANKAGRPWGVSVSQKEISIGYGGSIEVVYDIKELMNRYWVYWRTVDGQEKSQSFSMYADALDFQTALTERSWERVHSIDITPEMRASIMDGQPLFQRAKAAVEFMDDGRAFVRALNNPDFTSSIHESAHVIRRWLKPEDMEIAANWAGAARRSDGSYDWMTGAVRRDDGTWDMTNSAEEKFARGFERYLAEGKAPTPTLRTVFEKMKRWMLEIYHSIVGSPIDVELNPEIRALFDRLTADEAELAGAQQFGVRKGGQADMFGAGQDMPLFTGTARRGQESAFRPAEEARTEIMPGFEEAYKPAMKGAVEGGTAEGAGPMFGAAAAEPFEKIQPMKAVLLDELGRVEHGQLYTSSGREIPDPPRIRVGETERKIKNDLAKLDIWLHEQGLAEAKARGDTWNEQQFGFMNPKKLTQSDKDALHDYLFGTLKDMYGRRRPTVYGPSKFDSRIMVPVPTPTTGEPFTFEFVRTLEKAPDMGTMFGQDVEPAGRYMNWVEPGAKIDTGKPGIYQYGNLTFENPLVMPWGEGYQSGRNWKHILSRQYNGLTGLQLSEAIVRDGYDGIVTLEGDVVSEMVDLTGIAQQWIDTDTGPKMLLQMAPEWQVRAESPAFKRWFGDSRVVDSDGDPLRMYHGTRIDQPFEHFDIDKASSFGLYGKGFYFTDDPEVASGKWGPAEFTVGFPTEDEALAAPGRNYWAWQQGDEWLTRVEQTRYQQGGYAMGYPGIIEDMSLRKRIVQAIRGSDNYKRNMTGNYLVDSERDFVNRSLDMFLEDGNPGRLENISGQPFNIRTTEILMDEDLYHAGGTYPVYLRIENPLDMDMEVDLDWAKNFYDQARAIAEDRRIYPTISDAGYTIEIEDINRAQARLVNALQTDVENYDLRTDRAAALYNIAQDIEKGRVVTASTVYDEILYYQRTVGSEILKRMGYDGITHIGGRMVGWGDHRVYIAFESEQVKSIFNRGDYDPRDPRILYQNADGSIDSAPRNGEVPDMNGAPLGTHDRMASGNIPPVNKITEEVWNEQLYPFLRALEDAHVSDDARLPATASMEMVDPNTARSLKQYLNGIYGSMADSKLASIRWGENRRDAALHNYQKRRGLDTFVSAILPYQFWYSRSILQWALGGIDRPAWFANYARLRNVQNKTQAEEGFPGRLLGKMRIPMPWLPTWLGGGMYFDPLHQIFPFEQLTRPWDDRQKKRTQIDKQIGYVLQAWLSDGSINQAQYQEALQNQGGAVWDKAMTEARIRVEGEKANPYDFIELMTGYSLPLSMAGRTLQGREEEIQQLPLTRTIQAATAWAKPGGVNVEAGIRRALGWPERGQLGDFYVIRELGNMAVANEIPLGEAIGAMNNRTGPVWNQALDRAGKYQSLRTLTASVWGDFFPEGEERARALQNEFSRAMESEDPEAMTKFFEKYPEYEARMMAMKWDDPQAMLKQTLISDVWDGYLEADQLTQEAARERFGSMFTDNFLNKETRSYDTINEATLVSWAKALGAGEELTQVAEMPAQPELVEGEILTAFKEYNQARGDSFNYDLLRQLMNILYDLPLHEQEAFRERFPAIGTYQDWKAQYLAREPLLIGPEGTERIQGADPQTQQQYYQYMTEKMQLFPGISQLWEGYFELPEKSKARKKYWEDNPMLEEYVIWKEAIEETYPNLVPYISGSGNIEDIAAEMELPYRAPDISQWEPALIRQLMGYYFVGESLGSGARAILRKIWLEMGRPGDTFETWLDEILIRSFSDD